MKRMYYSIQGFRTLAHSGVNWSAEYVRHWHRFWVAAWSVINENVRTFIHDGPNDIHRQ